MSAPPDRPSHRPLREALVVYALVFVGCVVVGLLGLGLPLVAANQAAFVAALFLYVPILLLQKKGEDLASFGITFAHIGRATAVAAMAMLAVFPAFVLGYHAFHGLLLGHAPDVAVARLARWSPPIEGRPGGLEASRALHVFAVGPRLVVAAGGAASSGARLTLVGDGPCEGATGTRATDCAMGRVTCAPAAGRACVVEAPGWRHVTLTAEGTNEIRTGDAGLVEGLPLTLDHGLSWWWLFALLQLGVVALPEEVFYRGYLQGRLDQAFPRRVRLLGADVGPSLVVTSALFALGHLAIAPGPERLAVFFPSLLFGWLRARSGSVVAPVLVHAASNVLIRAVASFYYPA